MVISILLF